MSEKDDAPVKTEESPRATFWVKVLVCVVSIAAASSFLVRAYGSPEALHVPIYVAWLLAIVMVLATVVVIIPSDDRERAWFWSATFFTALSLLLCWESFGPGERVYIHTSSFSLGPVGSSGGAVAPEAEGRTFFGVWAVACVLASVWMWKKWRKSKEPPAVEKKSAAPGGWHQKRRR